MNNLLSTNPRNLTAFIIRITLGLILFPHGAQKLLGWFGGYGFSGTMGFFTGTLHMAYITALLVILIECFGSILLFFGFLTRIAAFGFICLFVGIIFTVHIHNGFFMNWGLVNGKGEGYEYHLLVLGISLALLVSGGGTASVDAAISKSGGKRRR
jgi:putative oxidoreductase